jgi:hypothetical protein
MAEASTHQQLDQMITGYWISQAIYAAAKFGIADHLKDGPKTLGELATVSSTNPDALYRLPSHSITMYQKHKWFACALQENSAIRSKKLGD